MIAIASDHAGYPLKEEIKKYLTEKGVEFIDCGTDSDASVDYAAFAQKACLKVTSGECDKAVLCCGTGIGISMAANKVKGIRAAVVTDEFCAEMTRRHNNANILCMGGRVIDEEKAKKLAEIFINTPCDDDERHFRRVRMIDEIENGTFEG